MKLKSVLLAVCLVVGMVAVAFAEEEREQASKDTPYFSGMPNYEINESKDREFDGYQFFDGKKLVTVEGKEWWKNYSLKEDAKQASPLQIIRNYSNAVDGMGGAVLFDGMCEGDKCGDKDGWRVMSGKVIKGGKELWVEVIPYNDGLNYYLVVVEKEPMKQAVTASDMLTALKADGHIALYINFDTGMAIIKPESQPVIDQIAVLMKENPGLKLTVEGHTDNVGDRRKNKFLSEERAMSVVGALVNLGIDPKRLTSAGFGQDKPIADNKTEEGKAKNRRVELVKK
jgi:OOP family OmpA-OmpF porin